MSLVTFARGCIGSSYSNVNNVLLYGKFVEVKVKPNQTMDIRTCQKLVKIGTKWDKYARLSKYYRKIKTEKVPLSHLLTI